MFASAVCLQGCSLQWVHCTGLLNTAGEGKRVPVDEPAPTTTPQEQPHHRTTVYTGYTGDACYRDAGKHVEDAARMLSWRWCTSRAEAFGSTHARTHHTPTCAQLMLRRPSTNYSVAAAEFDGLAMVCCRCTVSHPGRSAHPTVCHTAVFTAYTVGVDCSGWRSQPGEIVGALRTRKGRGAKHGAARRVCNSAIVTYTWQSQRNLAIPWARVPATALPLPVLFLPCPIPVSACSL